MLSTAIGIQTHVICCVWRRRNTRINSRSPATSGQGPRFLTLTYGPQLSGRRKGSNGIAHGH